MPILDDDQFESYLKQFHPLLPDALPRKQTAPEWRRRLVLATWTLSATAMIALGVVGLRIVNHRVPGGSNHSASLGACEPTQPLTIRNVNALLATASSYKSVMDELSFPSNSATVPSNSTVPKDKLSALAVLAKEKVKL